MTIILIATGAIIGAFAVLAIMAMRHVCETNDRPWDEYPARRRPEGL